MILPVLKEALEKAANELNITIKVETNGSGGIKNQLTDEEIESLVLYQVGAIQAMAKSYGLKVSHVRLHGALYKKAIEDFQTMCAIAKAIKRIVQPNKMILLISPL